MSSHCQRRDLSNCGAGRLVGILSVKSIQSKSYFNDGIVPSVAFGVDISESHV